VRERERLEPHVLAFESDGREIHAREDTRAAPASCGVSLGCSHRKTVQPGSF
jgi:hypothetical protein